MRGGQSGVLNGKQPPEQDQLIDHIQAVAIDQSLNETSVNPELVVVEGYGHWPFHRLPGAVPPVVSEVGSTCSPVAIEDPSALAAAPKSSSSVHASTTSSSAPTSVAEEVKVPWVNGLSIE
jgi:hypothetical protein